MPVLFSLLHCNIVTQKGTGTIRRAGTLTYQVHPSPSPSSPRLFSRAGTHTRRHTSYCMLLPRNAIPSLFRREWKSIPVLIRTAPSLVGENYNAQFPNTLSAPWVGRCYKNTNYKPRSWRVTRYYWAAKRTICGFQQKLSSKRPDGLRRMPGLSCDITQSILTIANVIRPLTRLRVLALERVQRSTQRNTGAL